MARIDDTGPGHLPGLSIYDVRRAERLRSSPNPLPDLQEQRDQFALAMRVRLGKDGFQLISRRLPGYLQFTGGDIGKGAARDDAGELRF